MYYNYYKTAQNEFDECIAKGICAIDPALTSLQEVIMLHLKELAFYLIRLKSLGVTNDKIREDIINSLSSIVVSTEYNQFQFSNITSSLFSDISEAKSLYHTLCLKNDMEPAKLKTYFKYNKNFNLITAIKKGEKYHLKKDSIYSIEQKNLFDIMLFLIKSVCIYIIDLKSYGINYDKAYWAIVSLLGVMSFQEVTIEEAKKEIESFIKVYYELVKELYLLQIEKYGEISPVEVSFSTRPGKAILVSGINLRELELVLKAVKGQKIDVYTHGVEMIMAHTYPKIRSYPNLIGHFGKGVDNALLDFATFPGPILMTKHSLQKVEYLYRGRLFTTDSFAPRGVVQIKNEDFSPLIHSALDAKGFSKGLVKQPMKVGFDEKDVINKINKIMDRYLKGEIKHIYIIGLLNYSIDQKHYFDEFFDLLPTDCFAISLSYEKYAKNVLHIDSFYDFSLIYKILKEMSTKKPLSQIDMSVFFTKCDKHTISNAINLKNFGIKNIFMCKCSTRLINPSLIKALVNLFGIKEYTTAREDILRTLKK